MALPWLIGAAVVAVGAAVAKSISDDNEREERERRERKEREIEREAERRREEARAEQARREEAERQRRIQEKEAAKRNFIENKAKEFMHSHNVGLSHSELVNMSINNIDDIKTKLMQNWEQVNVPQELAELRKTSHKLSKIKEQL